jgi:L-ascorbate metabolism protein UlaG (beta-lactamase superfamily)
VNVTKYVHSCLLVETPERVALFDPGVMSEQALDVGTLSRLDDIFITHVHGDHLSLNLIKQLVVKFPSVRITGPAEVVAKLGGAGITASDTAPNGVVFFESPHESVQPLSMQPEQRGIHYLDILTDPGDSHSFHETKAILALPVAAPWGSTIRALNVALELKPAHVLPIHDWHWNDTARAQTYDQYEEFLGKAGIQFHKLQTGVPVTIEVAE